jgi:Leucine-rich repeat (LRR) protein
MKTIRYFSLLFSLLFVLPDSACAQCFACEAYAEALKAPEEVRMLQLKFTDEKPDDRIAQCKNLQVLFWENAGLTRLPDSFASLQNLTDLSLANNAFVVFPEVILQLKNLKVLNLQGNLFDPVTKEKIRESVEKELPGTKLFL